jgi:U3 small nucleolar RNA-associated protein 20
LCILFFSHCAASDRSKLPLTCEYGQSINSETFLDLVRTSVRIIRRTDGNDDLAGKIMQMLMFLSQCADMNGATMQLKSMDQEEDDSAKENEDDSSDENSDSTLRTIPAIQYILDQLSHILRAEPKSSISSALLPKQSALQLLSGLIPTLSNASLPRPQIHAILLPLQHLTNPSTTRPHSTDPTFTSTYSALIDAAHTVMEATQKKIGDAAYVKALTEVSKIMRERREERRKKRNIERVAEPEKAAREKKRKGERKKERLREIARGHMRRRREIG